MRFTYAEAMVDPSFYVPLARAAEEAGYDAMTVADSICYPEQGSSRYPYNPDGSREFLEDKPFVEPFTLIGALGAVTERLQFATFVLKVPVRHPLLVAKAASSAAVLTGDRLLLGVGVSPWREDYEVLDVPWEGRGRRMDEAVEIIRGLMAGGYFSYDGDVYSMPAVKLAPVPSRPVPILVGGHSEAALRRAARLGDGWMHAGGGAEPLPDLLARLAELRAEHGRDHEPFRVFAASADAYSVDGLRALEEQGVTDVIVGFRWPYHEGPDREPLQRKLDDLRRYADTVMSRVVDSRRHEPVETKNAFQF
ncbi:MAG: TIGR03619 family F420-dependent LLM class oxidoreductase [Actinobacteria bacterium]|nr:TIGR03619 family F420-dependent LLM class oxidoreductase [Actinomycetota bacterium]